MYTHQAILTVIAKLCIKEKGQSCFIDTLKTLRNERGCQESYKLIIIKYYSILKNKKLRNNT
jgi:hypothetical protein